MSKKNCNNCCHLEWIDADEGGSSGFVCNKPRPKWTPEQDNAQIARMDHDDYLNRGKVCFEPINTQSAEGDQDE